MTLNPADIIADVAAATKGVAGTVGDVISNMTDTVANITKDMVDNTVGTANAVTDAAADIATAPSIYESPEYKTMLEATECPLSMEELEPMLNEFVTPCSANITYPAFCEQCVSPVKAAVAGVVESIGVPENGPMSDMEHMARREKCGKEIVEYMESQGLMNDDYFKINVMECQYYTENPACPKNDELLTEILAPTVKKCDELVIQMDQEEEPEDSPVTDAYCKDCYWSFLKDIVNHAMDDEFWCLFKGMDWEDKAKGQDNMDKLADAMYEEPGFMACMENGRSLMRKSNAFENADPLSAKLANEIRSRCWTVANAPTSAMDFLTDETKGRLEALVC